MKKIKGPIDWAKVVQSAETIKIKELELEVKRLKKKVEKQEKQLKEKTQQLKTTRQKLKSTTRKLRKQTARVKTIKTRLKKISTKVQSGHRSRAQYLAQQKDTFITRFISRMLEDDIFFTTEGNLTPMVKIQKIMEELRKMTYEDIDTYIYLKGLRSAYYESDGKRERIGISGDEIYEDLVKIHENENQAVEVDNPVDVAADLS